MTDIMTPLTRRMVIRFLFKNLIYRNSKPEDLIEVLSCGRSRSYGSALYQVKYSHCHEIYGLLCLDGKKLISKESDICIVENLAAPKHNVCIDSGRLSELPAIDRMAPHERDMYILSLTGTTLTGEPVTAHESMNIDGRCEE